MEELDVELSTISTAELLSKIHNKVKINSRNVEYDVEYYANKVMRGDVVVSPDFQRRKVWDKRTSSLFIESLIYNLPTPPLFLVRLVSQDLPPELRGKLLVVDGQQRTLAIVDFLQNRYELTGVSTPVLEGRRFRDLDEETKNRLLQAKVPVVEINIEADSFVDVYSIAVEIFRRLNIGAKRLTLYEVMFSAIPSPLNVIIKCITEGVASCVRDVYAKLTNAIALIEKLYTGLESAHTAFRKVFNPQEGEIRRMYDRLAVAVIMLTVRKDNPILISKWKRRRELMDMLSTQDVKEILHLTTSVIELLNLARDIGLERSLLQPKTYGIYKKSGLVPPWLVSTLFYALYKAKRDGIVTSKCVISKTTFINSVEAELKNRSMIADIARTQRENVLKDVASAFIKAFRRACKKNITGAVINVI